MGSSFRPSSKPSGARPGLPSGGRGDLAPPRSCYRSDRRIESRPHDSEWKLGAEERPNRKMRVPHQEHRDDHHVPKVPIGEDCDGSAPGPRGPARVLPSTNAHQVVLPVLEAIRSRRGMVQGVPRLRPVLEPGGSRENPGSSSQVRTVRQIGGEDGGARCRHGRFQP